MADGILGLGSSGSASLNDELIDKLKAAEKKATVDPIETQIEELTTERETFTGIQSQVSSLLDAVKPFDLFVSGGVNAFDNKSATTSGDSVTFNASSVGALNKGTTTVDITSLAQKDVYQTNTIDATAKDSAINQGELSIKIGDKTSTFDTTDMTYEQLAEKINSTTGVNASLEQVGTDSYRIVLKSSESGTENALEISGAASSALGLDAEANHTLKAQDLEATVDGVEYKTSTNTLSVDGLTMTASKTGTSSINVVEDNSSIETQMNEFITQYNALVDVIDDATTSSDSEISDSSSIRDVLEQVKDKLFGMYGDDGDKSIFNYGIELNKNGHLSLDSDTFNKAVENDKDGLKDLFIGTAAKEGLGTQLKAVIDELNFSGGALTSYESYMDTRETTLEEDKTAAEEALDAKYEQMSAQFASYTAIISSYESSFSSLSLMISQSTSSS